MTNYHDYSVCTDYRHEDNYNEESQVSKIKFGLAYVDHDAKLITECHTPVKCREYLSDWVCAHTSGQRVDVYGMVHDPAESGPNPLEVLILHGPKVDLERVQTKLRHNSYHQIRDFSAQVTFNSLDGKDVLILKVPTKVFRSPFGIMLLTCWIRALSFDKHIRVGPIPIPSKECAEYHILRDFITAFPAKSFIDLLFTEEGRSYLVEMKKSRRKQLDRAIHSRTGPRAMAEHIKKDKSTRRKIIATTDIQVITDQYVACEKYLRKVANG